jgi:hypothetical protein
MMARAPRPWPGALDWGGDWLVEAAGELAHLGFVLRDGLLVGTTPGPRLLLALRDQPTLEHFDPEEATFWEIRDGRGRPAFIDRETPLPLARPFAWGRIEVTDRIPVSNEFLGFGGMLLAEARDEHEALLAFTSRAPIVRWAGHSQGVDPLADEIGSFFARLMVPIDFQDGAEARIAATAPEALFAAFLSHSAARLHPGGLLRETFPDLARFVDHERHRMTNDSPARWREGEDLLGWLELG